MRRVIRAGLPLFALVFGVMVSGCASTPDVPPPVDPVGYFEFTTSVEGQPVVGSIEVRESNGRYTGVLATDMTEPVEVVSAVVEDQQLTIISDTPDGPVNMVLLFTGDTFTGSWTYAGMSGTMTGRRVR